MAALAKAALAQVQSVTDCVRNYVPKITNPDRTCKLLALEAENLGTRF